MKKSIFFQINLVVLGITIRAILTSKNRHAITSQNDKNNFKLVLGVLGLIFTLGITWIFGLLFFNGIYKIIKSTNLDFDDFDF